MRLLVLVLALAACQSPDLVPEAESVEEPSLLGTEWRLAAIDGDTVASPQLITITFSDAPWEMIEPGWRSMGGYDGCNDFGVGYQLDGERFRTGGGIMSNAMACGPPGGHVSDSLHIRLSAARTLHIDRQRLHLADSLGVERLAFVPRPVHPVDSTAVVTGRWRFDPAASTVTEPDGRSPAYHVAFAPDGSYRGQSACATFTGTYGIDGDRLRVTSFDLVEETCAPGHAWVGPVGLDSGELAADADRLVIHHRQGTRAVFSRS